MTAERLAHTDAEDATADFDVPGGQLLQKTSRRMLSRIFKHLDALTATRLWGSAEDEYKTVMLSAGGQGNGSTWIMLPSGPSEWMPDSHFIVASAVRLGRLKTPAGATCQLVGRDGD
eukprot:10528619-Karenia_brevis.AAC.1